MDKKELRKQIRELKRAMSPAQIERASSQLGEQFAASELYQKAKTIYGYLPYNQEVRTIFLDIVKNFFQIFLCKVICHAKIHV